MSKHNPLPNTPESTTRRTCDPSPASPFEPHYMLWREADQQLGQAAAVKDEAIADSLIATQSRLMAILAGIRSRTAEDVAFKLALWRFDSFGAIPETEDLTRADRLAYSAYVDLVEILALKARLKVPAPI